MNFRIKLAAWFALSFVILAGALIFTAHRHLDEELREDRWDRSHPEFPGWVIHGSYTDEEVHDILGELIHVWLWVGVPLLLSSLAVGYVIARRSLRPVRRINQELASLHASSLARGLTVPEQDAELVALVAHINDLLGRVGKSYAELAEFSARVAHELRTPLAIMRMKLEASAGELPSDFSEEMQEELHRLSRLVERVLLAAKAEGGRLEVRPVPVDLSSLMNDLHEDYAMSAEQRSIALEWRVASGLHCCTDPEIMRQILHNLLSNAVRHGADSIRVTAKRGVRDGSFFLKITNRIGEPRPTTDGVGIGLRLVRALIHALGQAGFRARRFRTFFSVRFAVAGGPASDRADTANSTPHAVDRSPPSAPLLDSPKVTEH